MICIWYDGFLTKGSKVFVLNAAVASAVHRCLGLFSLSPRFCEPAGLARLNCSEASYITILPRNSALLINYGDEQMKFAVYGKGGIGKFHRGIGGRPGVQ